MCFVLVAGTDLVLLVLLVELRNHHRTSRRRRGRSKTQLLHHCIRENFPSAKLLDEEASFSGDLRSCTSHLPKQSRTLLCSGWVRLSLAWSSRRHRPLLLCWPTCSWLRSWGSRTRGSAGSPCRGGTATARTRHLWRSLRELFRQFCRRYWSLRRTLGFQDAFVDL
jgi:hypothetical protein